jgi:hypothetical protein
LKIVNLPDDVYEDLSLIAEELTAVAGRPVSVGMAVVLIMEVFRAHLRDPCARDNFQHTLATANLMSPEEFEKGNEELSKKNPKASKKKL